MEALELTRRQWLLGSLGLAAAGCSSISTASAHIVGGICGPDDARGHLLRDPQNFLDRMPSEKQRQSVVILGGGVAGLSAAWRLRRAGFDDFVVLELEDQAGGTARFGQSPITPYPWGAHYLPVPSRNMVALGELLREFGVLQGYDAAGRALCGEQHLCRAPQERIFYKGRWYEGLYLRAGASAEDLRQLDQFHEEVGRWVRAVSAPSEGAPGGRRAFTLPRSQAAPTAGGAAELDTLSMATYLDRIGLTSPRLRFYVDYACRDDFGLRSQAASAWAGIHYYAARLEHPDDAPPEVLTWPEGNGWLVQRLLERVGDRVKTGCLALDVRRLPQGGADRTEVIYVDIGDSPGAAVRGAAAALTKAPLRALRARHVIFALPTFLRPRLIADLRAHPPDYLSRFSYAPWLVANLTVRRAHGAPVGSGPGGSHGNVGKGGFPPCWDNVVLESPSLGYVVANHQREPALCADGQPRSIFTYYLPLCDGDPGTQRLRLFTTPWNAWRDFILADLGRAEPNLAAEVERIDIFRWGHGMIRPLPGLLAADSPLEAAATALDGIHFAHTDLAGMALFEEAHHAGVRAAEAVLRAAGHPFAEFT